MSSEGPYGRHGYQQGTTGGYGGGAYQAPQYGGGYGGGGSYAAPAPQGGTYGGGQGPESYAGYGGGTGEFGVRHSEYVCSRALYEHYCLTVVVIVIDTLVLVDVLTWSTFCFVFRPRHLFLL